MERLVLRRKARAYQEENGGGRQAAPPSEKFGQAQLTLRLS